MKALEKIFILVFIIGWVLKIFLIPGGNALIVISLILLSYYYLIFSFAILNDIDFRRVFKAITYKGIEPFRLIAAIILGMSLSSSWTGVMFIIQHWEGGLLYFIVGIVISLIMGLIIVVIYMKRHSKYCRNILIRIAGLIFIGALSLWYAGNVPIRHLKKQNQYIQKENQIFNKEITQAGAEKRM